MPDASLPPDPPESTREALRRVIDHCDRCWCSAHEALGTPGTEPEELIAKKAAYNDVYQFAQALLRSLP